MSESPLLSLRIPYRIGSAEDPRGKEGLASVTARLIAKGSTRNKSY